MATEILIKNLQNKSLYNHPIKNFKVLETHISWVILTGEYCYKIKKPVDFEFLNFNSLEKRKEYCFKELELNKILAPDIYLEVLPIAGTEEKPIINGSGKAIEYMIKMKEFSQLHLFNILLENHDLHSNQIIELAHELADFHEKTATNGPEYFGTAKQIFEPVEQNFQQIRAIIKEPQDLIELQWIEDWTYTEHQKLIDTFQERKQQGFVRACHGDVHLGNITLFNNKPVIFDCIEFNESFRWTDTMADLGFLLMDLLEKGQKKFAHILLNTYLMHTGDYTGLQVLLYYQVYRAVVRAKISLFEYTQQTDPLEAKKRINQYRKFINLALQFIKPRKLYLLLTHGYSSSGKSTLAKLLVKELGVIQIRSDVERKRLQGIALNASSHSGLYADMYSTKATEKTYSRLLELCKYTLAAGYPTIIDATFQKEQQRKSFITYAKQHNISFCIIYCQASMEKLLEWIEIRNANASISEANKEVLLAQQENFEPLTDEEIKHSISVNTENPINIEAILSSI